MNVKKLCLVAAAITPIAAVKTKKHPENIRPMKRILFKFISFKMSLSQARAPKMKLRIAMAYRNQLKHHTVKKAAHIETRTLTEVLSIAILDLLG